MALLCTGKRTQVWCGNKLAQVTGAGDTGKFEICGRPAGWRAREGMMLSSPEQSISRAVWRQNFFSLMGA